jgi:hypothetical protein
MSPRSPVPGAGRGRTFYVGDDVWAELDRTYSRYRAETQDDPKLLKHEFAEQALLRGLTVLGREVQRAAATGEPARQSRRRSTTSRRAPARADASATRPAMEDQPTADEHAPPAKPAPPTPPQPGAATARPPRRRASALLDASDPGRPALASQGGTAG